MSEEKYHEGDLVEAVKGEKFARSRLVKSGYECNTGAIGLNLDGFGHIPFANSDERGRDGWTFTVIEKAKPPLPTEPSAIYSIVKFWGKIPAMLHEDHLWYFVGYPGYMRLGKEQVGKTWETLIKESGRDFEVLGAQS